MESWKRIDKYQINLKRLLGQGSYASVYVGRSTETGENVAVKMIERRLFMDSYNLKNLQSEIDIMKKVHHENIVKLYDVYQTTNNMYIITELCDSDLETYLCNFGKDKSLSEPEAKRLIKQIMKGARYLHSNGIIHRDLKPANILLKDGICKISDFGFAKNLEQGTVMRSIVGTPLYMSPQILKGMKYTSKSDLWSIGLIYYEMLHGRTPWPAQNEVQLITAIYSRKPIFSREITDLSKDFIEKCLQINQADRFSWEEAFDHKLLKQFSRLPKQGKECPVKQSPTCKVSHPGNKQNKSILNTPRNKQFEDITYIKNVGTKLKTELSDRALEKLFNFPTNSPNRQLTVRTPSRSRTVAKFTSIRITPSNRKERGSPRGFRK